MNSKIINIAFYSLIFGCSFEILGENLFLNSPEPKNRIAAALVEQQQESLQAKKEVTNGIFHFEKTIGNNVSLFAMLPYTRLKESGERKTEHLNQQQVGVKFLLPLGESGFAFTGGSSYYFATGRERLGIGSEKFSTIELNGGLFYRNGNWALFSILRWNSQLTPYLREREGQQFEKAWYFDFWLSYTQEFLEYILEVTRKVLYDPQKENLYSTIVSPGILIHLTFISLGIAVPITASRSYVPDGTLAHPEATFQRDDFDKSLIFKAYKYF